MQEPQDIPTAANPHPSDSPIYNISNSNVAKKITIDNTYIEIYNE
jgi:hypothetical protein